MSSETTPEPGGSAAGGDDPPAGSATRTRSLRALTARQRVLLIVVLLAVPAAAFGLAELGLRIAGYGSDYPLFVPTEAAPGYLHSNPRIAQRYFRHQAGAPVPMADLFRAEKKPGTYRIFVQGGSTAAGFPYGHGGAFSRMLEQRLQATFPETAIEVVNVSLDATNSYTLRDLVPEILEQDPDAILLYAGHNEYYGVLGVASAESVGRVPALVRAYIGLRTLRTVQWLQDAMDWGAGLLWDLLGRTTPPRRTLMEYLASEHTVRYDSPLYHAGIGQLRANLDAILRAYAEAGVPVFVGTLASNERDQPPFVSRPAADSAAYARHVDAARTALERDDSAAAWSAIDAAEAVDPTTGEPFYLRGRLLDRTGSHDAARTAYRAARDRDQLPFRAPSPMNDVIRVAAERHGATVVGTLDALAGASPDGIVDRTVMLEHLHPDIGGQFLLADAFYRALREAGEIGDWSAPVPADSARRAVPVTAVDSIAGALTIASLTARFPFQPRGSSLPDPVAGFRPGSPVERIALAYHRGELEWLQALGQLQQHYQREGRLEDVIHVSRVMAQEVAYAPQPLVIAAEAAYRLGRDAAALRYLEAARERGPTSEGAWLRGTLAARSGDTAAARRYYRQAVERDPANRRAQAAIQALGAIPELQRAVEADPSDADALANLAITYFLTGRYDRARELAERALVRAPGHAGATQVLDRLDGLGPVAQSGNE